MTLRLLPPGDDPLTRLHKARASDEAVERRYLGHTQHLHALLEALRVKILEIKTQRGPNNTILAGYLTQARKRADNAVGRIPREEPTGSAIPDGNGLTTSGLIGVAARALKREIDEARLSLARLRGARFP